MRKSLQSVFAFVLLVAMAAAVVWLEVGNETVLSGKPVVIDGDSLEINGERLRLQGIDAPELTQRCEQDGAEWQCGRESRSALRELVGADPVLCRTVGIDKYDRWLVECEANGMPVNERMVEQGWAVAYGDHFEAEEKARKKGAGIWGGTFEQPRQWRDARRGDVASSPALFARTAWTRMKRLANSLFGL